jgi:hypothetical protein
MGVLTPILRWRGSRKATSTIRLSFLQSLTYALGGGFFLYLMYVSMLHDDVYVRGAAYGDLPFHMNIISSFAHGRNSVRSGPYDLESSFYSGERLAYPFMVNFLSAALMATGGATLRMALLVPSSLMILSLLFGLYAVTFALFESDVVSSLSVLLFINLGGLGWVRALNPSTGYSDYTHNWGQGRNEYWFHPLFHVLVPQRASLFSMPFCWWAMVALVRGVESSETGLFALAGLLVGLTPLVQVHSFAAMAQFAVFFALFHFRFDLGLIGRWAVFGVTANVLGLPQLVPFLGRVAGNRNEFLRWNPIWNDPDHQRLRFAPVVLWWRGLGYFGAIAIVLGVFALDRRQLKIYAASWATWLITNFVRYQPWNLDNTKLFYAAWVPLACGVVASFIKRVGRHSLVLAALLIFVCVTSALLHTVDCLLGGPKIFEKSDIDVGVWIAENTLRDAVFLTSDWHCHPAATIAGRILYAGYGGWIHSHGLNYFGRTSNQSRLQNAPSDGKLFDALGIEYVVSRHHEMRTFEGGWLDE